MMLAAVYHGADDLRLEERPVPEIGPDEVLVRVREASICGTDLRILHGAHRKFPAGTVRIPGHEVYGTIAQVGRAVTGVSEGQPIFVAPNMGCGHCRQCISGNNNVCANYQALGVTIDGAFAEYVRVPAAGVRQGNLISVTGELDPAVAALIEPFACVLRGQDAIDVGIGDFVLVMGAGPIGIMHTKLARARGARRVLVSEPLAERRTQAERLGADRVVDPASEDLAVIVKEDSGGEGADAVIVAAPSAVAQESALGLAAIGGRVNFFGGLPKDRPTIQFDSNLVHYKELRVTATTACSTSDCWRAAQIVSSGRVDLSPLVSARFPLREVKAAFAAAEDRKTLKIVVEP